MRNLVGNWKSAAVRVIECMMNKKAKAKKNPENYASIILCIA